LWRVESLNAHQERLVLATSPTRLEARAQYLRKESPCHPKFQKKQDLLEVVQSPCKQFKAQPLLPCRGT